MVALVLLAGAGACDGGTADRGAPPAQGPEHHLAAPPARSLDQYADALRRSHAARLAVAKRWGLAEAPLTPPAPPAHKPKLMTRKGFDVDGHAEHGFPPVFTTVPTRDKVVFLTIDDGTDKDPEFLRMMSDLRVPYSAFLTDSEVKNDYGYFRRMQDGGIVLHNHTLSHPVMPSLSYAGQKREICGMQDVLEKRYGDRSRMFRPPYGEYDRDTLRAAKACGIEAVPLWNAEVYVDRWEYREWDRDIHPGDVVLTHFRGKGQWKGTMPDMIRRFLKSVTDKGYAVARLEDYV